MVKINLQLSFLVQFVATADFRLIFVFLPAILVGKLRGVR
jgi:hypothetical protein